VAFPEIDIAITHLREVLGEQTYESLTHKGETMTTAAMATYAYDQIDQARAELDAVSKQTTYESLESPCQSRGYGFRYTPWPPSQLSILSATDCHPGSSIMLWPILGKNSTSTL
jgi:hypothetical protein